MFKAKPGEVFEKGTWVVARRDGVVVVNFCCPNCGAYGTLYGHPDAQHIVAKDGAVTPSVVCDCGFHDHVTLVDFS